MAQRGQKQAAYRRLFIANALGLVATGLATVALALLAFELAGEDAGAVLGTALAIKMAVNVLIAPVSAALFGGLPRRGLFSALALFRAGALLLLPLVDAVWQVWVLVAVFQVAAASAATTYQASVPDLLPDEQDYARAVSKSKIAYEAETLLSPLAAALLLFVLGHREVFVVSVILFALSAVSLRGVTLPAGRRPQGRVLAAAAADVLRLLDSPAMRGALLLGAAAITVTAMVTVNTVVLVRGRYGLDDTATALGLAAFGAGGIAAALALPPILRVLGERVVMLRAGAVLTVLLASGAMLPGYFTLLALWLALGATTTLAQLPALAVLRRIWPVARQGIYAAHYAITSAAFSAAYLAAGWVGAEAGLAPAFLALAGVSLLLVLAAARIWPPTDSQPEDLNATAEASSEPLRPVGSDRSSRRETWQRSNGHG